MIGFLHMWLVKARVLSIPPGSKVRGWWGEGYVECRLFRGFYRLKSESGGGYRRDQVKVLSLPPRLTSFERRVQSYIDQELKQ